MNLYARTLSLTLAVTIFAGCASTAVSDRKRLVYEKIPKPNRILVYNFAATPADVPADSDLAGQYATAAPQTAEEIQVGRELGAQIAGALAEEIRDMGLTADAVAIGTPALPGQIVIKGYLLSIDAGSAAKRLTIGFGAGASELRTMVEGYQMTRSGLRKLGSGTVDSGGGKAPGGAVGVAGLIATGNPVGLIVSGGVKVYDEASGRSKLEGRAKATAEEIGDQLEVRFKEEGWI